MTQEHTLSLGPLARSGFIRIDGADSGRFLQGQLSRDVQSLGPSDAPLGAWHSAAGRAKAIFRVLRLPEGWLLVTDKDLVTTVARDLERFVLRDDVRIGGAGDRWHAVALLGNAIEWLQRHEIDLGDSSGHRVTVDELHWIRIGPRLVQVVGSKKSIGQLEAEFPSDANDAIALEEISLGLPQVTPELQDRFIPQMLNLDILGALDEHKDCYPGQEIITRTQNLGTVKRRMLRFSAGTSRNPAIGSVLLDDTGAPAGNIIRSSAATGRLEILAVTRLDRLGHRLFAEAAPSVPLRQEPLPYESELNLPPPA